jgi:hypothetical protein
MNGDGKLHGVKNFINGSDDGLEDASSIANRKRRVTKGQGAAGVKHSEKMEWLRRTGERHPAVWT